MASVNKVILIGNLGRDPELRYTKSGQAVANFSVATTDVFTNRDGNREERTEWHRIVTWAKTAEQCARYLHKGRTVYIEGQLRTRDWEDKDGNKRQTTEIHAQTVQFLGSPGEGRGERGPRGAAPEGVGREEPSPPDDDIPF